MAENTPITPENVLRTDIQELTLDKRFGSLVFDNAQKKLSKAQTWLKEVKDLKYEELLLDSDTKQVNNIIRKLAEHLEWVRNFEISSVPNPKQEHDGLNSRVDSFFNDVYSQIVMRILPFLRDERRKEKPDEHKLDEEIKKVVQLRTDLEKELKSVQEETEKIRITGKVVGSAKGQRAAVRMASHFDNEVARYEGLARKWLLGVAGGYLCVVGILIWLGVIMAIYLNQIIALSETINTSSIWSAVISKLVILAALWYGLSFIIKNYNVNSQLAAVNRHRAAVARTLEDFVAVEQQQENPRLSEMLQNATDAMFKNMPIGFVSKTEKETSNPVLQIVNDLIGIKNNT